MKNILTVLGLISMLILSTNSLLAVKPIKNAPQNLSAKTEFSEKQNKKIKKFEKKIEKKIAKMEAKANKAAIDLDDPVEKWMWFWIFGWGAGLVLTAIAGPIGIISFIGGACILFGTVSLILWIVKKFS